MAGVIVVLGFFGLVAYLATLGVNYIRGRSENEAKSRNEFFNVRNDKP
jgi:hypothetical protein